MNPEISVVIVTWNGRHHLERCLPAVAAQVGVSAETIVVDNGSTDGTVLFVRERFPWVRIVALDRNTGFAGGNNAGARHARGELIAFLNNDTIADAGWLRALKRGLDAGQRYALVTSRIVYMHDPAVIDSAGDGLLTWGGAFKRLHGQPAALADQSQEVFGVSGAGCMMPRRLFDELGGFDEDFFASHEDVDLSYRARLRGYRCRYVADAVVQHRGSATLGTLSRFSVFQGQRNLEWMYVKNTPASLLVTTLPGHLLYNVAAAAYFARHGLLATFVKAKAAAFAGLPRMLRRRFAVQRGRTVGAGVIRRQMERRWLGTKLREKRFEVGLAGQGR